MKDVENKQCAGQSLTAGLLLEEIRVILKDSFVAQIRKAGDELVLRFPGGKVFRLTVWRLQERGASAP